MTAAVHTRVPALLALALAVGAGVPACGGGDEGNGLPGGRDCGERDVLDLLREVPGLTAIEQESDDARYRAFALEYEQPVDHDRPDAASFVQRMTLLHADCEAPMVLHTTGYYEWQAQARAEPTVLLDANQLDVEQRFFEPSRPDPADWSLLTIQQAAADHHRIIAALRPFYTGAWVSTGASKGGMTSIYHRRFYPDDVDATVAYVAPISFGAPDDRYQPFFDTVGEEVCRARLRDFQRELLTRRTEMLDRMAAEADRRGLTFERLGGIEAAFEEAVVEFAWGFWQFAGANLCGQVPDATSESDALYDFFSTVGASVYFVSDPIVEEFAPYAYQAGTQLGYPSSPREHIEDLLTTEIPQQAYLPDGATAMYDGGAAMEDIDAWVESGGKRLLFIYGEYDPWYAGAFQLGQAEDSFVYVAPQANHGALIQDLTPGDQEAAVDALARWTRVEPELALLRTGAAFAARRPPASVLPPPAR